MFSSPLTQSPLRKTTTLVFAGWLVSAASQETSVMTVVVAKCNEVALVSNVQNVVQPPVAPDSEQFQRFGISHLNPAQQFLVGNSVLCGNRRARRNKGSRCNAGLFCD